jgi:hypothetical protein
MSWTMISNRQLRAARGQARRSRWSGWFAVLLLVAFRDQSMAAAEENPPSEYQLKAAFLYNFAKFIEWPPGAFSSPQAPFVIGVIGTSPFDEHLERTVQNKRLNGHPFEIKQFKAITEVQGCHMLFICSSERRRLGDILKTVNNASILTVSELERFLPAGGMVQFVMEDKKVRFDINPEAAHRADLRISSKLMSVARRIYRPKTP